MTSFCGFTPHGSPTRKVSVLVASHVQRLATPWTVPPPATPRRLLCPWNSPGKDTGVGRHSLHWRIFLAQGSNPGLLHCRRILYRLSHQGSLPYEEGMLLFPPDRWGNQGMKLVTDEARIKCKALQSDLNPHLPSVFSHFLRESSTESLGWMQDRNDKGDRIMWWYWMYLVYPTPLRN